VLYIIALEVIEMDKVIIYGTYHFLGFSLCQQLLDAGIEVCGFRLNEENSEDFLEEKKCLIGRNANFEERRILDNNLVLTSEQSADKGDKETIIVISFYDMYYSKDGNPHLTFEKIITNISKHYGHALNLKLICLYPIEFVHDMPKSIMTAVNLLKKKKIQLLNIYIPTVFGPWQPSVFLFQQYLLKEYLKSEPKLDYREFTSDAIYIKDIIDTIIQLMESGESEDCLIQSSSNDQWEKGAEHLKFQELDNKKQKWDAGIASETIKIIKVKESISIAEGLENQKRHISKLY
jgi:hypothetical protein